MKSILAVVIALVFDSSIHVAFANSPVKLPDGTEIATVDFERHVTGLFSRLGCNAAACHGSFQGKGGFRLSLFGQSAALDYAAVRGENGIDIVDLKSVTNPNVEKDLVSGERRTKSSSRVDLESPDASLLLAKPSNQDDHGGGLRLPRDSWEYSLIRQWIAEGARRVPDSGKVVRLTIEPPEIPALQISQRMSFRLIAEFAGGDRLDVTPFSEFRSRDSAVVEINEAGELFAKASGDTSIIVSYGGTFLGIPLIVPHQSAGPVAQTMTANNWIDDEVNSRLIRLNLASSSPADDVEFLRRVTLDVIGLLPTPAEVRSFLDDDNPNKRLSRIDALLAHPRRAASWATKMCDITGCNIDQLGSPDELRPKRAKMWHDWFRKRFAENTPYDQIVHGVLCATSRMDRPLDDWVDAEIELEKSAQAGFETNYQDRPGLDYFWRRIGPQGPLPVEDLAEITAAAFLGLRLHCARCHQHPYDHWTQEDFAGFATIFARAEFGSSTELRTAVNHRLEQRREARRQGQTPGDFPRIQEVFLNPNPRPLNDAFVGKPVTSKAPGGPILTGDHDSRETLFRWLTQPDNPYFAASFVNRVWARYFGSGLVDPVDSFSIANPPVNPRLLDRLTVEFVKSGYDIQKLERLILASAAYQRSARSTENNAADRRNLARATVRPLLAEVLLDSLNAALETTENFGTDVPAGSQAIELAPNRFADPAINDLFRILGRGDRKTICDCSRAAGPSIRQPLYLMSDPRVMQKIRGGRLSRMFAQNATDAEILDEFYLATLSRHPDADEQEFANRHIVESQNRGEGFADIVWALINSREFSTNH